MLYFICALPFLVGLAVMALLLWLRWRSRWYIHPELGSDRNHGHSARRSLKTHAECMRRIGPIVRGAVFIHLLGDVEEALQVDKRFGRAGMIGYEGRQFPTGAALVLSKKR